MNCQVSETGQFFGGLNKKKEKLTGQLVSQETDQNHMDIPNVLLFSFWLKADLQCYEKTTNTSSKNELNLIS